MNNSQADYIMNFLLSCGRLHLKVIFLEIVASKCKLIILKEALGITQKGYI